MRRAALVAFSLALLAAIGVVFTRTIAARVPQQRATLEKLIADRTGLQVRFDNVHFAWNLDGTSAVFTRVELTDPKANRVRVRAPELRVKFDTWDFLRHQQFSFGHVTLASPDIEIQSDGDTPPARAPGAPAPRAARATRPSRAVDESPRDEAALLRRYTAWMEAMPTGRIEVEGARVHLKRRDEPRPHHTFTLSQAVVSRGAGNFNAWGTLLLAQDVGQSLFVSAKAEGLAPGAKPSVDLRLIARRVFLDKLAPPGLDGRGTLDAKLQLRNGRLESATWQASAREIAVEHGPRFDHVVLNGRLSRDHADVVLDFDALQLTRGARLERAPALSVRFALEPGSLRIARATLRAERVPFLAGELFAALAAPHLHALADLQGAWSARAGELRDVVYDSGGPGAAGWTFAADVSGVELARADHARLSQLAARVRADAREISLELDPAAAATLHLADAAGPRTVSFGGTVILSARAPWRLAFTDAVAQSGASRISAGGEWRAAGRPLDVRVTHIDRALAADLWKLVAEYQPEPALLAQVSEGAISGSLQLVPGSGAERVAAVDWPRSRGDLEVEALASTGEPRLSAARGALTFARGAAQLRLSAGRVDDLMLTGARLDWPRRGEPRLKATLSGTFDSPVLRRALAGQGLDRMRGSLTLDAEARGEEALHAPERWRLAARVVDASLVLAADVPPIDKLAGTVRHADGALRALDLDGQWLGGPVSLEGRRAGARAPLDVSLSGVAGVEPLLRALGRADAASRVDGVITWTGSAQRVVRDGEHTADERPRAGDGWLLTLASNLVGLESRFDAPFAKPRARAVPLTAELRVDSTGIQEFTLGGREVDVRGEVRDGRITAAFALAGAAGELRHAGDARTPMQVHLERIAVDRAPALFAATQALLSGSGAASITIADLHLEDPRRDGPRAAPRSLGALRASLARNAGGLRFELESSDGAAHRAVAQGSCAAHDGRCRAAFTFDTQQLAALLRDVRLPPEWPAHALQARGELHWPDTGIDLAHALTGTLEIEAQGAQAGHQLIASATLADGELTISNLQGSGPEPTQLFRGSGRVGLLARDYDLAFEYERVSTLAANTVPTPARAPLARAWNALRGSAARRGWADAPEMRRVQWHGYWDVE